MGAGASSMGVKIFATFMKTADLVWTGLSGRPA